jgi:hypothetical protein
MRSHAALRGGNRSYAVVAGGPDTAGREAWLWDLSVDRGRVDEQDDDREGGLGCLATASVDGGDGLRLRFDDRQVVAELTPMTILPEQKVSLQRSEKELVVIVPQSGRLKEGIRVLDPGDVLVVEGDYPAEVDLIPTTGRSAVLAIGRLRRHDGRSLRWMP